MQKCWTLLPKKTCSRVWVFCMDVVFKRYGHVQWTAHRSTQYDLPVHVATNYALTSRMQAGVLMRRRRWRCLANGTGNCATDWDLRPGDARHVYVDATRSALWHLSCCCCFVSGGGCWLHGTAPARSPTLLLIVSLSLSLSSSFLPVSVCVCVWLLVRSIAALPSSQSDTVVVVWLAHCPLTRSPNVHVWHWPLTG